MKKKKHCCAARASWSRPPSVPASMFIEIKISHMWIHFLIIWRKKNIYIFTKNLHFKKECRNINWRFRNTVNNTALLSIPFYGVYLIPILKINHQCVDTVSNPSSVIMCRSNLVINVRAKCGSLYVFKDIIKTEK